MSELRPVPLRACELCEGESLDELWVSNGYSVDRCQSCGLVFVTNPPTETQLRKIYDDGYWEDASLPGYTGYAAAEARKRFHARTLLDRLSAFIETGSLLEVGSAYGYFLDEARKRGWRVRGVEPSTSAAERSRANFVLDVHDGSLESLPDAREPLDAVVMWDVIEHLRRPLHTLRSAAARLRPGGVLALSTGDIRSLAARIQGENWSLLTPPWHLFYFSRATAKKLVRKAGFEPVFMGGDGVVGADPGAQKRRLSGAFESFLLARPVTTLARRLGLGTIFFLYAIKKG